MIFSEAKAAVDLAKDLAAWLHQTKNFNPEVMQKFDDLRGKVLAAYETEIELREKIRQLEQDLEFKQMVFDDDTGLYYQDGENGKREYFCQRCADVDKKRVHVISEEHDRWLCLGCNRSYKTQNAKAATRASIAAHNERQRKKYTW